MDIDFLSCSPSLLNILELVEYPEVGKCRLVSRQFHDVICRNSLGMKRPQADMNIIFASDVDVTVNIKIRKGYPSRDYTALWDVHISNEQITIYNCKNQSILDHYSTNSEVLEDEQDTQAVDIAQYESKVSLLAFRAKSMVEELRSLFSLLFLRYRFHDIKINPDNTEHTLIETTMDMICEISRKNRSGTFVIKTSDTYSKPEKLVRALGACSLDLSLSNRNISEVIFPCASLMSEHSFHSLNLSTTPDTFDSLQPLVDIVMGWTTGRYLIETLSIIQPHFPFPWSEDDIIQAFSHIPGYRLPNEEEINDQVYQNIKATFVCDDTRVVLLYHPHENILEILSYEAPSLEDDDVQTDSDASID